MVHRVVPASMHRSWDRTTQTDDPLGALASLRALRTELSSWEGQLIREARQDGRTWEEIGMALGVSADAVEVAWRHVEDGPAEG